jgi:hypothetical protein
MEIAYYQAPIPTFVVAGEAAILGELTRAHGFAVQPQQRNAWLKQISLMKQVAADFKTGHILRTPPDLPGEARGQRHQHPRSTGQERTRVSSRTGPSPKFQSSTGSRDIARTNRPDGNTGPPSSHSRRLRRAAGTLLTRGSRGLQTTSRIVVARRPHHPPEES